MRVILATPIYPPEVGGPVTYIVELAQRLRGNHHIVVVAYTDSLEPIPHTHLIAVSKKNMLPVRLYRYFFTLLREARQSDVIYVQNAVATGLPAVLVGWWLKKPVILKFVGDEAWERATQAGKTKKQLEDFYASPEGGLRTKLFMTIERFVLQRASLVTTPSAYLAKLITHTYNLDPKKVVVNYNAVAAKEASELVPERVPYRVSIASRLVAWKHIDQVINVVAELHEKYPEIELRIAGVGPDEQKLKELVYQLDAESFIKFLGQIPQRDSRALQASAQVHVLNSTYEGMPYEVLNAFAMTTAVVATNIPGTNEVVEDEKTGLLVPAGDEKALAGAIERLFTDPALRERVAQGGAKILKEKFSWEAHLATLERMLGEVAKR
jgi:glycosyltransferase involved in cell wall biosynthesis